MASNETIIFEYGTEGGGAEVYKLPNGKIIEKGSSGGILDEDKDPIKTWEYSYDTLESWWLSFTSKHKDFWIFFHPIFIHADIKEFIQVAVDNYKSIEDSAYHTEIWNEALTKTTQ